MGDFRKNLIDVINTSINIVKKFLLPPPSPNFPYLLNDLGKILY